MLGMIVAISIMFIVVLGISFAANWWYYERLSGGSGKVLAKYEETALFSKECMYLGEYESIISSCWYSNEIDSNKINIGDYCEIRGHGFFVDELKCGGVILK